MDLEVQEVLDRSYAPQLFVTFIGTAAGIGAKALIGSAETWQFSGLFTVLQKDPLQLCGGLLLYVISLIAFAAAGWIGIGILSARWHEMHPGDRVVRVGVLGLLALSAGFVLIAAIQFLFLVLAGVLITLILMILMSLGSRKRVRAR